MKLKSIAMTGVLALSGLGLIGVGAHAAFTQNTTSAQTITAGTINVTVSSPTVGTSGNGTQSITLPPVGPVGSTFSSVYTVDITNNSPFAVDEIAYTLTDPNALANAQSAAFDSQAWACIYSDGYLYANEPLATIEGYGEAAQLVSLAPAGDPGSTDAYSLVIYAGPVSDCGAAYSGWSSSPYQSPNGTVVPSSYTGAEPYTYSGPGTSPGYGVNTGAASLTDAAEAGVIIPTFTVTYDA
jgi:predicted ribosomally synthesized peptide with SipW-like signal peptide